MLIAALLEIKARHLFPDEEAELSDLEPEEAAEELARRLAEYRRMKEAAVWLRERLADERERFFRLGPAPLAPRPERRLAAQDPAALASALRGLAVEPPKVSLSHMALRFPPVSQFLERFRAVLRRRRVFDFDTEVAGLTRVEQAVAFLALLELRKAGEIALSQAAPVRSDPGVDELETRKDPPVDRPLRLIAANPVDALARTVEALLVVASQPLSVAELAEATRDDPERIETALGLLGERYREGRSGIVLEPSRAASPSAPSREAAEACGRLFERPVERGLARRRSRRSRSSPTSARSRDPRSRAFAASRPTRRSPPSSSVG